MDLTAEALKSVPIIAVMWFMLKDLRANARETTKTVTDMAVKLAATDQAVKVAALEKAVDELKADAKAATKALHDADKQLAAVWTKIGDRPEDIRKREQGGQDGQV